MQTLTDKVAIVTGAAHPQGMGFAACKKLAEQGARVLVTDLARNAEERSTLEVRARELWANGSTAIACPVDVTDRGQIAACVTLACDRFGGIDILFNNAGSPAGAGPYLALTDAQWDESYRVNLKGVADFCQAVIPEMQKRSGGSIINNSSLAGLGASANMAAYIATKFAVIGLTKAIAAEFGSDNIRCNAVCPGNILTQMGETAVDLFAQGGKTRKQVKEEAAQDVALRRWASADEVADVVLYLAGHQASYITGVALPVAGGLAPGL